MLPLTLRIPKPAVPVLGRPLICQILQQLAHAGVFSVTVNLHHQPQFLRNLLGGGAEFGLERLDFSEEETILGTAGGILRAAPYLRGSGTILVRNADFLADIDLGEAAAAHRASGYPATLVLAPARAGYSTVEVDARGGIVSLGGEPAADPAEVAGRFLFTGCHFIEEELLDRIPSGRPSDIVKDVYRALAAERRLASYVHTGFWWEFGTPLDYLEGSLLLLDLPPERRRLVADTDPVVSLAGAVVAEGAGADFHVGVALSGRVALGFACFVAEGSHVEDSVIMPEAWVGPGCRLRRVIVGPGAELQAGFEAEECLVCDDPNPNAPLPPETERVGGLLRRRLRGGPA